MTGIWSSKVPSFTYTLCSESRGKGGNDALCHQVRGKWNEGLIQASSSGSLKNGRLQALPSDVSSPFGSWPATELDALQLDSSSFEAEKLFSAALSRELPDRLCQADVAGALASIDQADFAWALSVRVSR